MDPFLVMNLQCVMGLIASALVARWYAGPALMTWKLEDALALLSLFHAFRYVALGVYAPGQVAADLPSDPVGWIVAGDTLSAVLAIIAAILLHARAAGAVLAAWVFNLVGLADIVISMPLAIGNQLYAYDLGFSWYVFTFYVPALIVTHVMMLYWLVRHARHATSERWAA